MVIYIDSSFLISLYANEIYSLTAINSLPKPSGNLLISNLVEIEFINALELKIFRNEINQSQAIRMKKDFEMDLEASVYKLLGITESAYSRAIILSTKLTSKLGCRSADILHVASALEFGATHFFSFDAKQRMLAEAVGLKLNPMP